MASSQIASYVRAALSTSLLGGVMVCAACGTTPRASGVELLIKPADARLTMDAAGAALLSEASGCTVTFRREGALGIGLFLVESSDAAVSATGCVQRLASLPSIAYAVENTQLRLQHN